MGRGLRFADDDVRAMGRASRGVIGIKLTDGDSVVGLMKVNPEKRMLLVTEKGQGKQVEFDQFKRHNRATMGQKIYTFRDKTGYLVGT